MRRTVAVLLSLFMGLSACEKNDLGKQQPDTKIQGSLIQSARLFFQKEFSAGNNHAVATSSNGFWSKTDKTPLWDKATVSKQPSGEFVVVPLKFSKAINLASNLKEKTTYPAEAQMKLVMRKNEQGGFRTSVYSYLPQEEQIIQTGKFSGVLRIEDWGGDNVRNLYFKNGRYKPLSLKGSEKSAYNRADGSNSDGISCYVLTLWACDVDNAGNRYNCETIAVIPLGCFRNDNGDETDWVDPPTNDTGNGNGAEVYYEEQFIATSIEDSNQDETQSENGTQTTDANTGMVTMNVGYKWPCGYGRTMVLSNLYNWTYWSYETGIVEKVNVNDEWKFQAPLAHVSIQRIGLTPLMYEYTHELGYAVSNVIMPARRKAKMEIRFVIYQKAIGPDNFAQTQSWEKSPATYCLAP